MRVLSNNAVQRQEFDELVNKVDKKQNKLILLSLTLNIINLGLIVFLLVK
jgi:hypothetical protein